MKIVFVSSGSKGNATLLSYGNTLIQIDMGVPKKQVKVGLDLLGNRFEDIDGVFITHEHADHVSGLPLYHRSIKTFASPHTLNRDDTDVVLTPGEAVMVGDILVMPFSSSHDAANPLNFCFFCGEEKLAYITDTGKIFDENLPLLKNCDYYLFESNHDLKMLRESSRPEALKRRIHGRHGHLSNRQATQYLCSLVGPRTKQIFLGHISDECNTTDLALKSLKDGLQKKGVDCSLIKIIAIPQKTLQIGGELL